MKNITYQDEAVLVGLSFPALAYTQIETSDDWGLADYSYTEGIFYPATPTCNDENGNNYIKTTRGVKQAQVEYYGITPYIIKEKDYFGSSSFVFPLNTNWFAGTFYSANKVLRKISLYRNTGVEPDADVTVSIRSSLTGSDLTSKTLTPAQISGNVVTFDFDDIGITPSTDYYIIIRCPSCTKGFRWHSYNDTVSGFKLLSYNSTNSGTSWSTVTTKYMQYDLYTDNGLRSLGSTTGQNYYFIDQMASQCQTDGDNFYDINGRYATSSYVYIDTSYCASGKICDATLTATSTVKTVVPSNICRNQDGESCTASSDCWHDNTCSGAKTTYNSLCDGYLVDIDKNNYLNSCGGDGYLNNSTVQKNNGNCTIDGGFAPDYVCDSDYDLIEYTSVANTYNAVCKGWIGTGCTLDSDCHHLLSCNAGFCSQYAYATFTTTNSSIYESQYIVFDNELSFSSDNDIQYSCWRIDDINTVCNGNTTQCTSQCNGATHQSNAWDYLFNHTFNTDGNYNINLTVGKQGFYNDSYAENVCVSGGSTYCWSCYDNLMNDDESGVDWGGRCGFPYFLKCINGVLNNVTFETGVDYGGFCGNCSMNSTSENDADWLFLKEAGLINVYPFNASKECPKTDEIQGFMSFFVLLLGALLIVPMFIIVILGLGFIVYLLFNLWVLIVGAYAKRRLLKEAKKRF